MPGRVGQRRKRRRRRGRRFPWSRWSDERLLDVRLCDLDLSIEGTWVGRPIRALLGELGARRIRVRPHFWVSEEWFSPFGVPGIAVPFFLLHPRLLRLERARMLEAEGSSREWCMRILRHEAGHVVQNAFRLHLRREWQRLFGKSSSTYPEYYRPRPASRRYVLHLDLWYAQSHPIEDFAETFAVWLQPRSQWRKRYEGWPALKKLEYVDRLMKSLADVPPSVRTRRCVDSLPTLRKTLRQHYAEKVARFSGSYPDVYDRDLRRLFSDSPRHGRHEAATAFLRRNRRRVRQIVSKWTGQYQLTLDEVLRDMIGRCGELRLRAVGSERQLILDFAILLTMRTVQYLYTSRDWYPL